VWLHHRFGLSFGDVEGLLAEHGITVTYETIRQWCLTFGIEYVRRLRARRDRMGGTGHLDKVFVKIQGRQQYLWRAVDEDGNVIDLLVQSRRNRRTVESFFRTLLKDTATHRAVGRAQHPAVREQSCGGLAPTDPSTGAPDAPLQFSRPSATLCVHPRCGPEPASNRSTFGMLGLDLSAPDHTTLSRRGRYLDPTLRGASTAGPLHLVVDSTGLSITGQGEWAAVKHGGRGIRGWKKLHLSVDESGVIVGHALTGGHVDDATTAIDLIAAVDGDLACVTADAAYDTVGVYEAAAGRGAKVVIPPTRTATVSRRGPRSSVRDRTIKAVEEAGRRRWQKESGYHRQGRVENAFFRYKSVLGEALHARTPGAQTVEIQLACNT